MATITTNPWPINPGTGRYDAGYTPGKYVILNGSFGAKVAPKPAFSEDFGAYADGALLIGGDWQEYQTNGGATVKSGTLPYRAAAKCAHSTWLRGQFATSWRYLPMRSKRVFITYMVRTIDNFAHDYGVWKPNRITSSTRSLISGGGGGGGVYNGVGCMAFSSVKFQEYPRSSGQTSFTAVNPDNPLQDQSTNVLGNAYQIMDVDKWVRVEGWVDLGTAGNSDGRFYTRCGDLSFHDYQNQALSSTLRDFYEDTILLGLDFANPRKWIKVNGAVAPNANYTITYNSVNYTVNSGSSPLTSVQIMEGLYSQLSAVLPTTEGSQGVFLSPDHTEIRLGDPNNNIAHTFSSNLVYRAYGALITDLVADYSRSQFYLTSSPTFSYTNAEALIYDEWTSGSRVKLSRFGGQLFDGTKYIHHIGDNETITLMEGLY